MKVGSALSLISITLFLIGIVYAFVIIKGIDVSSNVIGWFVIMGCSYGCFNHSRPHLDGGDTHGHEASKQS